MKRAITAVLFLILLLSLVACGGEEASATEGLSFFMMGERTYTVELGQATAATEIVIPDTYLGIRVAVIGRFAPTHQKNEVLARVTVPAGVDTVGNSAFLGCTALESVTFLEGSALRTVGMDAFRGCTSLSSITLPEGVEVIGTSAFFGCTALREIAIPAGVSTVPMHAFTDCTSLTAVTVGEGVVGIGYAAFSGCTALERITLPASITYLGDSAFSGCTSLRDVYFAGSEAEWAAVGGRDGLPAGCTVHIGQEK